MSQAEIQAEMSRGEQSLVGSYPQIAFLPLTPHKTLKRYMKI
jgi:hypothetical protein